MKKQFPSIRFFLFVSLLFTGLFATANNQFIQNKHLVLQENYFCFDDPFTYSWATETGAVSYVFEMVNTNTQQSYKVETTATFITFFGVPGGTYALTVTAEYANHSSSIIVVDVINH